MNNKKQRYGKNVWWTPYYRCSFFLSLVALPFGWQFWTIRSLSALPSSAVVFEPHSSSSNTAATASSKKCAVNFYGLPRSFSSLVLPSLVKHVIQPNAAHGCDYFVQYYDLDKENAGRSGGGGTLNVQEIFALEAAVTKANPVSTVSYIATTDEEFWRERKELCTKIATALDNKGRTLYFPWKAVTYKKPSTTDNVVKMWHSVDKVWDFMETAGRQRNVDYSFVAMLRSDVLYMTPIDLFEFPNQVVVPGFGRYPVSDRCAYGPARGVKVWAKERFSRLDQHVQMMLEKEPGFGMQSERFMQYSIFPHVRNALGSDDGVLEHPSMCFFRARADESVWISDCWRNSLATVSEGLKARAGTIDALVADVIGRPCHGKPTRLNQSVRTLDCHSR